MKRKNIIALWLGASISLPLFAQNHAYNTIRHDDERSLLLSGTAAAAHVRLALPFMDLAKTPYGANVAYDLAETRYHLAHAMALESLSAFIDAYPTDNRRSVTSLHRAALYMGEGDFNRARHWLEELDETALSALEQTERRVRWGYSLLKTNREGVDVSDLFAQAAKADNYWGQVASFYVGSELMSKGKLADAEQIYRTLLPHRAFAADARIGLAAIDYFRGNYSESVAAIAAIERQAPKFTTYSSLLQVAGNAYYRLGDAPNTIKYLSLLRSSDASALMPEDWLLLGAAYMEDNQLENAISPLLEATRGGGLSASVGNLYLGRARRDLGRYTESIAAYELASADNVSPDIREAAMYEMALVMRSSGLSNFGQDVRVAERFLKSFPKSKYVPTMETFLTEFYLSNTNYATSWASIQRLSSKSPSIREARQYVLNHLALESLQREQFSAARDYIALAKVDAVSEVYAGESLLIEAEVAAAEGRYDAAVKPLREFLARSSNVRGSNTPEAQFRLGYALFNSARMDEAADYFSSYLSSGAGDALRQSDAAARWADCRYAHNAFEEALRGYERSVRLAPSQSSYALFRSAEIYGLKKEYNRQIGALDRLITTHPDNAITAKATYEKGRAYLLSGNTTAAESTLRSAYKQFGSSESGRQAQLQLALLYYNTSRTEQALSSYALLMKQYPRSQEASVAFANLKNICIDEGRMDYINRITRDTNGAFSLSDSEARSLEFQTAEAEYRRNPTNAEQALNSFVARYHTGADVLKAHKYLADIAYQKGDEERAYELYRQVVAGQGELSEAMLSSSLNRLGILQNKRALYAEAYKTYRRMYSITTEQVARKRAAEEALLGAYRAKMYREGVAFAEEVLASLGRDNAERLRLYLAHCNLANNKEGAALEEYKQLSKNRDTEVGAEALVSYAQALSKNPKKRKEARKLLNDFIEKGTSQEYWLAKGIIILSDIYRLEGDSITAQQYLESLRNNYPSSEDDIYQDIDQRLANAKIH